MWDKNLEIDDAVGVLLNEEAHRKSSGSTETWSALNVKRRGRPMNKDKKKMTNPNPNPNQEEVFSNRGVLGVGGVVRRAYSEGLQAEEGWRRQKQREGFRVCHRE